MRGPTLARSRVEHVTGGRVAYVANALPAAQLRISGTLAPTRGGVEDLPRYGAGGGDAAAVTERSARRTTTPPAHATRACRAGVVARAAVVRVGAHVDALATTRGLATRTLATGCRTGLVAAGHTREPGIRTEGITEDRLGGGCVFAVVNNPSVHVAGRRRGGLTPCLALRPGDARANGSAGAGVDAVAGRGVRVEAGATTGHLVRAEVPAGPVDAALPRRAGVVARAAGIRVGGGVYAPVAAAGEATRALALARVRGQNLAYRSVAAGEALPLAKDLSCRALALTRIGVNRPPR